MNLTWSAEGCEGIITYDLYFGETVANMALKYEGLKEGKIEISDLTDGKTYYWKITAEAQGLPTAFESEIWHFTVRFGFTPTHKIEMCFESASVSVKRGDSVIVDLTLRNPGNVAEDILLEVPGDLKGFVSKDERIELGIGEEKMINITIFAESKLELKIYDLTIEAVFSGERTTASMNVKVTGGTKTGGENSDPLSWVWFVVGAILIIVLAALLIFIILRNSKKTDDEEEIIEAEIEARAPTGITQADLEVLSIGGSGQPGAAPFQGRSAETPLPGTSDAPPDAPSSAPPTYTLPSRQVYQHRSPAGRVTSPELNVTGTEKDEPEVQPGTTGALVAVPGATNPTVALPQVREKTVETGFPTIPTLPMKSTVPGASVPPTQFSPPTGESPEPSASPAPVSPQALSVTTEPFPGASNPDATPSPLEPASSEAILPPWDLE